MSALRWMLPALLCALPAAAEEKPAPPATPEMWLPPVEAAPTARIQRRFATKEHKLLLDLGPEYLARGDFYTSFGVSLGAQYYLSEDWALDLAGSRYFPFLLDVASEIRDHTGYVPDSQAPHWLVRAGLRTSLGYGKLLFGDRVVHLEPQAFARLAMLVADRGVDPGLDLGFGLLVHWTARFHTRLELAVFPHAEKRTSWVPVVGVMPLVTFGFGAQR